MTKVKVFSLLLMTAALFFGASSARSQLVYGVKIYVTDGSWTDSVHIGVSDADGANDAIGDSLSPTLMENELPPTPPAGPNQAGDVRLVDPAGGNAYGQGVALDIREFQKLGRRHVYRLKFRRSAPEGSNIVISWPSGLGAIGGGGFYITDGIPIIELFQPVDMTQQTSYSNVLFDDEAGTFVDIVVGDGTKMRSFTADSIALARDSKGKQKAEKRKPISVDFLSEVTNTVDQATIFYVEFGMITTGTISFSNDTDNHAPIILPPGLKKHTINIPGAPLDPGVIVTIDGHGEKGKPNKGKWYFTVPDVKGVKADLSFEYQYLRMPFPNLNNVGDEVYLQGATMPIGVATPVGTNIKGKPIIRHIYHPKYKDVMKTMWSKKPPITQVGDPFCLATIKDKEVLKAYKALPPDKTMQSTTPTGNRLIGEMTALKFNIMASLKEKTGAGFGEMKYMVAGHPYEGYSMNQIMGNADSVLACLDVMPDTTWDLEDLTDFLAELNAEWSGPLDTVSFGSTQEGKAEGGTVITGMLAMCLNPDFQGGGAVASPVPTFFDYSELYDVPAEFSLAQNYPNPFNPTTTIEFSIPEDALVTLAVYNMLGQEVARLADREEFSAGFNDVEFDASMLSTGVYYYKVSVNDGQYQQTNKMVLMK